MSEVSKTGTAGNKLSVDVIIPSYKPDEKFQKILERLGKQTVRPGHIFVINTEEQYFKEEKYPKLDNLTVIHISKKEFDHGGTRNYGASLSTADIILFMTQDAIPADKALIEEIRKPFESEEIGAVYGRQLAYQNSSEIEKYTRKFNYPEQDSVKSAADLERLGIKTYFCSNVCAAYRREVYEELGGFVLKTIFNEDMIMASQIINGGYKIAYASNARVYHSHKYTYWQQFTRNFDLGVSQKQYKEIFGQVKSESEGMQLVKNTMNHLIQTKKAYLIPDLIIQSGFKYLGYKAGNNYEKIPHDMLLKFSMNPSYWERGESHESY